MPGNWIPYNKPAATAIFGPISGREESAAQAFVALIGDILKLADWTKAGGMASMFGHIVEWHEEGNTSQAESRPAVQIGNAASYAYAWFWNQQFGELG